MFKKPVPVNVWYFWKVFYFSFGGLIVAALEDIKTSSMSLLSPPSLRFQPLLKSAAQPYLCLQRKTIILLPLQLSGAAHTHTHTCLCPTDGRQSAPLSACLDTVQLVSCCISPSSPLSDSARWLRAHSYLIRQLFSCRGRRAERILISFGEPTESPALRRADTMGWF